MISKSIQKAHTKEYERLSLLTESLSEYAGKKGWPKIKRIDASLKTDSELQSITSQIRTRYLLGITSFTSLKWRTPPEGIARSFPGNDQPYAYTYDRHHPPIALESRFQSDKQSDTILLSSGMAALNVIFQALNFLSDEKLSLAVYASYFETLSLFRIGPFSNRWSRANSESELAEIISNEKVGIVFIEPVHYEWELHNTDWTEILTALKSRKQPPILIIDSTLSGGCKTYAKLQKKLCTLVPIMINARSGIKLDQQGLELTNLGVVELWCEESQLTEKVGSIIRKCRSLCGAALSWPDACTLAPESIFSEHSLKSYSKAVFKTARQLYDDLQAVGPLFSQVSHPPSPWGAPLVVLLLTEGGSENYTELSTILDEEQRRRNIKWQMSGSFGFRTQRFETILPEELLRKGESHNGALKIASGCYLGARQQAIIELILEISNYPDLKTVRKKLAKRSYPAVKKITKEKSLN